MAAAPEPALDNVTFLLIAKFVVMESGDSHARTLGGGRSIVTKSIKSLLPPTWEKKERTSIMERRESFNISIVLRSNWIGVATRWRRGRGGAWNTPKHRPLWDASYLKLGRSQRDDEKINELHERKKNEQASGVQVRTNEWNKSSHVQCCKRDLSNQWESKTKIFE